jgi:hypothetical protein
MMGIASPLQGNQQASWLLDGRAFVRAAACHGRSVEASNHNFAWLPKILEERSTKSS